MPKETIPPEAIPDDQLVPGQHYRIVGIQERSEVYHASKELIWQEVVFRKHSEVEGVLCIQLLQSVSVYEARERPYGWYCYLGHLTPKMDPLELAWFDYLDQVEQWDLTGKNMDHQELEAFVKDGFNAGWQAAKEHFTKEQR